MNAPRSLTRRGSSDTPVRRGASVGRSVAAPSTRRACLMATERLQGSSMTRKGT